MIGFVISSHGEFGTGRTDKGSSIVFSCGLTSPIDVLLKEFIVKNFFNQKITNYNEKNLKLFFWQFQANLRMPLTNQ